MQRTETRQVGGAAKSSFAEATFAPVEEQMKWETLLPEAVALEREREEAAARAAVEGIKHPRRRNQVRRKGLVDARSSANLSMQRTLWYILEGVLEFETGCFKSARAKDKKGCLSDICRCPCLKNDCIEGVLRLRLLTKEVLA